VDHPLGVRGGQAGADLPADPQGLGHRQRPPLPQAVFEGLTLEQFHRQEGGVAVLAYLVDCDDVVALERGAGAGLAQEALAGGGVGGVLRQDHLERHLAPQVGVLRLEDHPHATAAQEFQHAVVGEPAQLARGQRLGEEAGVLRGRTGLVRRRARLRQRVPGPDLRPRGDGTQRPEVREFVRHRSSPLLTHPPVCARRRTLQRVGVLGSSQV
jgi:hypothetical protein